MTNAEVDFPQNEGGKTGQVAGYDATFWEILLIEVLARGAGIKVDGLSCGSPVPPAGGHGPVSELLQRRVSGWNAPLKLPAAISVAFTPMALPAVVPRLRTEPREDLGLDGRGYR